MAERKITIYTSPAEAQGADPWFTEIDDIFVTYEEPCR